MLTEYEPGVQSGGTCCRKHPQNMCSKKFSREDIGGKRSTNPLPRCAPSATMVYLCLALLCLGHCVPLTFALDHNDIQGYLRNVDMSVDRDNSPGVDMGAGWGVEDVTAVAGKVFKYSLPKDLFHKGTSLLKLTEKGKTQLPPWLEFDEGKSMLKGVPGTLEAGKEVYIEVTPVSSENSTTLKDIFSIKVVEDSLHADTSAIPIKNIKHDEALKPVKCVPGSSVTMATVIVDTDISGLRPVERVGLMESMCEHLGMPSDLVRLQAVGHRPMFDSLALVAGPGDIKHPMHSGAMIQWEVGCGNVFANHMPILQQLENTAHNGSMGKSVGYDIIGWHVTNNKPQALKRVKRQAFIRPTSTPDLLPPLPTKQPGETSYVKMTDEAGVPPSRTVPSVASPEFPEIKPTHTHSDHHHHHTRGPKTHGRHHDHITSMYEPHPSHHSKVHKSIMATPTVLPITPTRVVDSTTSSVIPTGGYVRPSEHPSSPGISRSDVLIEPSMTSAPSKPTSATKILPTRTYPLPGIETTEPVHPTTTDRLTRPTKVPPIIPTDKPVTKEPSKPPSTTTTTTTSPEEEVNFKPDVKEGGLSRIDTMVGDILDYEIPKDNFMDREDGNTRNLDLTLMTIDNMDLPPSSWLRLDPVKQRLYGLPMPEHSGRNEYILAAIDSHGGIVKDAFEIYVRMRSGSRRINHEMSMVMQLNYDKFAVDVEQRIDVAKKLARAFGDRDMSSLTVTNIAQGSVVYSWTNNSVPTDTCPESTLLALAGKLVTKDGSLNPQFKKDMMPYEVSNAEMGFQGTCKHMAPITSSPEDGPAGGPGNVDGPITEPERTSEEEVLVTTVAPAVVIGAMLLLGALIACILYRKRRKGKLSDEDQHTFIQKGIPIILPDELDDKPDPPTKPLIMTEELPPQPPPEYPHSPSPSTPRSTHKEPLIDTTDDEADHHSPLYRPPPPPMSGSLGHRNSRPRTPLSQRSPPQYMSPISP